MSYENPLASLSLERLQSLIDTSHHPLIPHKYEEFNTGQFGDSGMSGFFTSYAEYLAGQGGTVNIVGLGEMYASSLAAIAFHFQNEITLGYMRVVATNKENFVPDEALNDARLRIRILPLYCAIHQKLPFPWDKTNLKQQHEIIFENERDIDLLGQCYRYLEFISNFDTLDLPHTFGVQSIQLVHEHYGGIYHHPHKQAAVDAVLESLDPQYGVFCSTDRIDSYVQNNPLGHQLKRYQKGEGRGRYVMYAQPDVEISAFLQ
jgi:hypothetical protein